jgi:hypothetical protein
MTKAARAEAFAMAADTLRIAERFVNASDYDTHEAWVRARHKFCGHCGSPMAEVTERDGFDRSTGLPIVNRRLRCSAADRIDGIHDDEWLRRES